MRKVTIYAHLRSGGVKNKYVNLCMWKLCVAIHS